MKKYEVYFGKPPTTNMEFLQAFDSEEQAKVFIYKYTKEHHQPNYYIRTWQDENEKLFDYGSWSKFYIIKKNLDIFCKFL